MDVLKKLIASEQEEPMMARHEPRRNRERSYFIRDNKMINIAAKMNEENLKKNLEEEITHRT